MFRFWIPLALAVLFAVPGGAGERSSASAVLVPKQVYKPFFREPGETDKTIGPLLVDRRPVTNADYLAFVKKHPQWRKSGVKAVFAGEGYLGHWTGDEAFPSESARHPVTNVSWFAARKYCEAQGKRLLTTAEWEAVSDAQDPKNQEIILKWYGDTNAGLRPVAGGAANRYGLQDMHGLIWEWVDDFASAILAGDSRGSNDAAGAMFCGAGSMQSKDPSQYASFMRFAYRSSLNARYTAGILGFRCARDADPAADPNPDPSSNKEKREK